MTTTITWQLDRVDASKMKTLALLLADPNPIHFDREAAIRLAGTDGRLVNQGPSTMALIYNLFATELPGRRVRRLDVRLLGNVLEGESVTVTATPAPERQSYDVTVSTPDRTVVTGTATLEDR